MQLLCLQSNKHTVAPVLFKKKKFSHSLTLKNQHNIKNANSKSFEKLSHISQRKQHNNGKDQVEDTPSLFLVGEDMCYEICSFLTPKYLLLIGQTCQFFYDMSNRDEFWHALHQKRFGFSSKCSNPKHSYYVCRKLVIYRDHFLLNPLHWHYGLQSCTIRKSKDKVYTLSLDRSSQLAPQNVRLGSEFKLHHLLYGKKATKCYLIATSKSFSADTIIGKLYFDNLAKTKFTIRDSYNRVVGTISYKLNVFGIQGPRKFNMRIPSVDSDSNTMEIDSFVPTLKNVSTETNTIQDSDTGTLVPNKSPEWSNDLQQYLLDFGRRAQISSVNNFKVEDNKGKTMWLLGKCFDSFCLDFRHPLSPLQAFSLALTCFATHRNGLLVSFFDD